MFHQTRNQRRCPLLNKAPRLSALGRLCVIRLAANDGALYYVPPHMHKGYDCAFMPTIYDCYRAHAVYNRRCSLLLASNYVRLGSPKVTRSMIIHILTATQQVLFPMSTTQWLTYPSTHARASPEMFRHPACHIITKMQQVLVLTSTAQSFSCDSTSKVSV